MTTFSICPSAKSSHLVKEEGQSYTSQVIPLPIDDVVSVQFFSSIDDVTQRWADVAPADTFFGRNFLRALELTPPSDSKFRYAVFSTAEQGDIGIGYFQIKTIALNESLRFDESNDLSKPKKILNSVKKSVAAKFKAYTLVVGNLTLTGNYGMYFTKEILPAKRFSYIDQSISLLIPLLKSQGIKVRGVMFKDYKESHRMEKACGYSEFSVQPTMTVHLDPAWATTDDYITAMKSKYRVRMRKARSNAEHIVKRVMTLDEIKLHEQDIARLYRYVSDQAGFNLFILKDNYFYCLAKMLGDDMKLTGYFIDDKMVGFFTSIKSGKALDAHFLGYDNEYNGKCSLYLNMLYDLVEEGIHLGMDHVDLSRTALEIKSSVGAVPTDLYLYLRLTNKTLDKYTPKLLKFLTPDEKWVPRNPFK